MKKILILVCFLCSTSLFAGQSVETEWTGSEPQRNFQIGILGGLSGTPTNLHYPMAVLVGYRVLDRGFIPMINNTVHAELRGGYFWNTVGDPLSISASLRWTFHKNETFGVFGIGGLTVLREKFSYATEYGLAPHVGVGVLWKLSEWLQARFEYGVTGLNAGAVFQI